MEKGPGTSVPGPFFAFMSLRVICAQVPRGSVNSLEPKGRERRA